MYLYLVLSHHICNTFTTFCVGRVPCAVFQKGICTLCEKDLAKKTKQYYVVGQPDTVYSASKLVGLFGPTCGPNRTTDIAIYIRAPDAQVCLELFFLGCLGD